MKRTISWGLVGSALIFGGNCSWASSAGTTSADILKIPVGARAIGMGEAYVAQAADSSALYWNPAGLALMEEREASFMYSDMYQGMNYDHGAIAFPLENGAIGGSIDYLNYGNIAGFDTQGKAIGDQSAYTGVGTIGAAWLGNLWSAGLNVKGIKEKLADTSANGFGADLGLDAIYPRPILGGTIRAGAVVSNLGQGLEFEQQRDPLPTTWKLGLAAVQMMDKHLNLSLDYSKPRDDKGVVSGGAEYWLGTHLALRTGYTANHNEGSGIRAGVGLRIKGIDFDYAYAGSGELGMTHRYELSFRFGEPRPILTPEERKILQQAKAAMRAERYEQATLLFDSLIELEPHYKPARRYIKVAMSKLEQQQTEMAARQGRTYNPALATGTRKPSLPDENDLEELLNLGTPHAAQTPKSNAPAVGDEGTGVTPPPAADTTPQPQEGR